jgi:glycosyltransferase involved in cell wall biosynthesis
LIEPAGLLCIAQVNTMDVAGGAERVALGLHQGYLAAGHDARLVVGRQVEGGRGVLSLSDAPRLDPVGRIGRADSRLLSPLDRCVHGAGRVRRSLDARIDGARRWRNARAGREDFDFPASRRILDLFATLPDLLHCHNLHGGFFDLRTLPQLSSRLPVVLTLHDAWLLSGHCAHSFECDRWKTGCGSCPDLTIYPSVERDATRFNWNRKRALFARSSVFVTAPSQWILDRATQSILRPATQGTRVIPNGIDLTCFVPAANRAAVRSELGIAPDTRVLLFAANGIRENPWKDFRTMRSAVARVAASVEGRTLLFLALGESGASEWIDGAEIRFVPYERDAHRLARCYQAADVYVHAARAETFGLTIVEAMACGTPVVATAVGGIPEIVRAVGHVRDSDATGFLVPPADPAAFASAILGLLSDEPLRERLGRQAAEDARRRFGIDRQVDAYLALYRDLLPKHRR